MVHASPIDSTTGKPEEHPDPRPPAQAEELSDEQLHTVHESLVQAPRPAAALWVKTHLKAGSEGRMVNHIQPCI
jgi:hypothetical protein